MNGQGKPQHTHTDPKAPPQADRFMAEQTRRLYAIAPINIVGSGIITAVLASTMWAVTAHVRILSWLACQSIVILYRIFVAYSYRQNDSNEATAVRWKRKYAISMALAGICWGSAAFFLFPETSLAHQFFLTLLLAGAVASASSAYAVEMRTYLYFSFPIFIALIVRLFSEKTTLHFTLCGMLVMLLVFLLNNIHRWNQMLRASLTLELENLDLRDNLTTEKKRIKPLDERLRKEISERKSTKDILFAERNQLRTLVDNLPDYIFVKDTECRFLLMNKTSLLSAGFDEISVVLGKTDFDLFPAEFAQKYYEDDQKVLRSGQAIINQEERAIDLKTGVTVWRSTSKIPFRDNHGKIAGIVGITRDITERKLREETFRQHNRELILLNHMSDLLQTCNCEGKTYTIVISICKQLFASDAGSLYILNDSQSTFEVVAHWGNQLAPFHNIHVDDCTALKNNTMYCTPTSKQNSACPHISDSAIEGGYICAPIGTPGEISGILYLQLSHYKELESSDQKELIEAKRLLATRIVRHYALFLSNLRLRETLRMEAIHDPLTQLYNRRYMEEFLDREIRHAKRQNSSIGIILFDIDHFKSFNDNYGHEAGDVVLRKISHFIKAHIRTEDIPCRYGGEEFLLIIPDISIKHLKDRAEELRAGIAELTTVYQDITLKVTISLGLATIPEHGQQISQVINAADTALYQAKDGGRNQVVIASAP